MGKGENACILLSFFFFFNQQIYYLYCTCKHVRRLSRLAVAKILSDPTQVADHSFTFIVTARDKIPQQNFGKLPRVVAETLQLQRSISNSRDNIWRLHNTFHHGRENFGSIA